MIGEFAVVMSVRDGKAVVLARGGQFLKIKDRNFHVGERIILEPSLLSLSDRVSFAFENTKEKCSRMIDRLKYKGLIILSSVVILVPTTAYASTKYIPWTYVSLDTGSVSIQYQLNARGEILSTESLNEESQKIVNEAAPKRFEKVETVVERTLNAVRPDKMGESKPVLFGISSRFGSEENTIRAITEHREPNDPADFHFEHLNWSDTGKARDEELSIGQFSLHNDPEKAPLIPTYLPENKPENPSDVPAFDTEHREDEHRPDENQERPDLPDQHDQPVPPEKPDGEENPPESKPEPGGEETQDPFNGERQDTETNPANDMNSMPVPPEEKTEPDGQNPPPMEQDMSQIQPSDSEYSGQPSFREGEPPQFEQGKAPHNGPPSGEPPSGIGGPPGRQ